MPKYHIQCLISQYWMGKFVYLLLLMSFVSSDVLIILVPATKRINDHIIQKTNITFFL
jgi:hypothetical protein